VRQAALGMDVVPDVNWIFTISWLERGSSGTGDLESCEEIKDVKGMAERKGQ